MMFRKRRRLGKLAPRYRFALNPFPDRRWSRCPRCEKLTYDRKFPLLIHVDECGPVILGKTARYCTRCEFIVVHQAELEAELAYMFSQRAPEMVGNDYLVMGIVERKTWQRGMKETLDWEELLQHTSDVKQYFTLEDPRPRWAASDPDRPA